MNYQFLNGSILGSTDLVDLKSLGKVVLFEELFLGSISSLSLSAEVLFDSTEFTLVVDDFDFTF